MHVCILGVCTGINVSDICQQRDVEMLPTASRRSAAICSQRFAALKRSRKLYNFLYVKLVAKFAFFFSLHGNLFLPKSKSSLFVFNILKFPWMLET